MIISIDDNSGVFIQALKTALHNFKIEAVDNSDFDDNIPHLYLGINLDPETAIKVNKEKMKTGMPWLKLDIDGSVMKVGPIFFPNQGACYQCLTSRQNANFVEDLKQETLPMPKTILVPLVANTVSTEIYKYIRKEKTSIQSNLLRMDFYSLGGETHRILRVPTCNHCGIEQNVCQGVQPWMLKFAEEALTT